MLKIIQGNILESKCKYICHQCNALTSSSAGLANAIFFKYPHSNIYSARKNKQRNELPLKGQEMGKIIVCGNGNGQRYVINMMCQFYPGKTLEKYGNIDGPQARLNYFNSCLNKIALIPNLESVAFPYKIGCNLGGGDWNKYYKMLKNFSIYIKKSDNVSVLIYKKE